MAEFANRLIALDLPHGWRQQPQTGRRIRAVLSLSRFDVICDCFRFLPGAILGTVWGAIAWLAVRKFVPLESIWWFVVACAALGGFAFIARGRWRRVRNWPVVFRGPRGEHLSLWVARLKEDQAIPSAAERLEQSPEDWSPPTWGGSVVQRGVILVDGVDQRFIVRENPDEALWDDETQRYKDVMMAVDYNVYLRSAPLCCRLFGDLGRRETASSRKTMYDAVVGTLRTSEAFRPTRVQPRTVAIIVVSLLAGLWTFGAALCEAWETGIFGVVVSALGALWMFSVALHYQLSKYVPAAKGSRRELWYKRLERVVVAPFVLAGVLLVVGFVIVPVGAVWALADVHFALGAAWLALILASLVVFVIKHARSPEAIVHKVVRGKWLAVAGTVLAIGWLVAGLMVLARHLE